MKLFPIAFLLAVLVAPVALAQTPQLVSVASAGYQPFTLTSASTSQLFVVTGLDSHAVSWSVPANQTGVTVTVSASTDGGTTYTAIASSTAGDGTISFSGTYSIVKVAESGMTAAMSAISGVYNGSLLAGNARVVAGLNSNTAVPIAVDSNGRQQLSGSPGDANYVGTSISLSATGTAQIIALSAGKSIYVTGYGFTVATSSATGQTVTFVAGTSSNCSSGQTAVTGALTGATEVTAVGDNSPTYISAGSGIGTLFKTPAGQALCITTTGTQGVGGWISAVQFLKDPDDYEYGLEPPRWNEFY